MAKLVFRLIDPPVQQPTDVEMPACWGCSSTRGTPTGVQGVFECSRCHGHVGECAACDVQKFWSGRWSHETGTSGAHYVDLRFVEDGKRYRIHGWVDHNGDVVQIG